MKGAGHRERAGPVGNAAKRGGLGQSERLDELTVGGLEPDRDLCSFGRRERDLDDPLRSGRGDIEHCKQNERKSQYRRAPAHRRASYRAEGGAAT